MKVSIPRHCVRTSKHKQRSTWQVAKCPLGRTEQNKWRKFPTMAPRRLHEGSMSWTIGVRLQSPWSGQYHLPLAVVVSEHMYVSPLILKRFLWWYNFTHHLRLLSDLSSYQPDWLEGYSILADGNCEQQPRNATSSFLPDTWFNSIEKTANNRMTNTRVFTTGFRYVRE